MHAWYEQAREKHGVTVEEFENLLDLPPFSVYPATRHARAPRDIGYLMYSREVHTQALAEEQRQIDCLARLGIPHDDTAEIFGRRRMRRAS